MKWVCFTSVETPKKKKNDDNMQVSRFKII